MPSRWRMAVSLVACGALAGCGGSKSTPTAPTTPSTPAAAVTRLKIDAPPACIRAGDPFQLTATATLSNGQTATTGFTVSWASSNTDVATVSATGLVTTKTSGYPTISASVNTIKA